MEPSSQESQNNIENSQQFVSVSSNLFANVFRNLGSTVKQLQNEFVIENLIRSEDLIIDIKKMRLIPKSECPLITEEKLKKLIFLNKESKKNLTIFINSQKKCFVGMNNPVFVRCYYSQQILRRIAYHISPRTHKYREEFHQNGVERVQLQAGVYQQLQMMRPLNTARRTLQIMGYEQEQQILMNEQMEIQNQYQEYQQNELQQQQSQQNEINNNEEELQQQLIFRNNLMMEEQQNDQRPVNGKPNDIHLFELQQKIDTLGEDVVMEELKRKRSTKRYRPNTLKIEVCLICKTYNENLLFCSLCGVSQHLYCALRFIQINNGDDECCACKGELNLKAVPLRIDQIYNDDYISDDDENQDLNELSNQAHLNLNQIQVQQEDLN